MPITWIQRLFFDTPHGKVQRLQSSWYIHHIFIPLIFLYQDPGTGIQVLSLPIWYFDIRWLSIALSDTGTSPGCRISPYKNSFTSPIYLGNHSDIIGLTTRPCIRHLSSRCLSYSRKVIYLLFPSSSPDTYPQSPIPPLHRLVEHLLTFILGRSALFILGILWISVEQATRKRGLAWDLWYLILSWLF